MKTEPLPADLAATLRRMSGEDRDVSSVIAPPNPACPAPVVGSGGRLGASAPTVSGAREILRRFCASYFRRHDQEHARASISADPRRDDDIRMGAFIDRAAEMQLLLERIHRNPDNLCHNSFLWEDLEVFIKSSLNNPDQPRSP